MEQNSLYRIRSAVLGHAVGDALGVPVEFRSRKSLDASPVKEMRGYGTYPYAKGTWSDDTSMCLCALDSLAKGSLNWGEIMDRYRRWWEKGDYSSVGVAFDIGGGCSSAIRRYVDSKLPPTECGGRDEFSNGNGSLMRMLPFVLFSVYGNCPLPWQELVGKASSMTHAHPRSIVGCGIYASVLRALLEKPCMNAVHLGLRKAIDEYGASAEFPHFARLFLPTFNKLGREEIQSSGYVVDTVKAALWCLMTTSTYQDCVLKAVNLGEDTDTTAAVAGGLAGVLYGCDGIPAEWIGCLAKREYIEDLCRDANGCWQKSG